MKTLFNIQPLLASISADTLILTPNRRLAAKASDAYAAHCIASGQSVWTPPRIMAFDHWLETLWQTLLDQHPEYIQGREINSRQQLLIWQNIVKKQQDIHQLLTPEGAASQCQSAYETLRFWQISSRSPEYRQQQFEPDLLAPWIEEFEAHCQTRQLLTRADIIETLIKAFKQGLLSTEPDVLLLDFYELPPLHQTLLDSASQSVQSADAVTDSEALLAKARVEQRTSCADADTEIQHAAAWAKQALEANADARIGIVIPDLNNLKHSVERHFRDQFEPAYLLPDHPASAPTYNLSLGESLAECPIINCALQLLSLRKLPVYQLPRFLYSPFLFAENSTDLDFRVQLEYRLRNLGKTQLSLTEIRHQAQQLLRKLQTEDNSPAQEDLFGGAAPDADLDNPLLQLVNKLLNSQPPRNALASEWAQWMVAQLQDYGWPGSRQCNSLEYQQIDQWYQLLLGFHQFDDLLGKISHSRARQLLTQETQAGIFHPMTEDSPIQILGPLEAAGLQFSHLWVMGLSDNQWPAAPSPHPLLPINLQRQHAMPHASPERELEFAQYLTQTYRKNAEYLVFSHPRFNDEQPLRPSALITELPECELAQLQLNQTTTFAPASPAPAQVIELETLATAQAPAVSAAELATIKGGSTLIKNQSLCPFSGFAIHRLNAKPLEQPQTGLSARDRGNIMHRALELFWKQAHSQAQLNAYSSEQLEALLNDVSQQALRGYQFNGDEWMGPRFWALEQARINKLLRQWLELEQQRPDFTVDQIEQDFTTEIAGLPLKLRIDRIDKIAEGKLLLMDYKTSSQTPSSWGGERLKEPQLPLYTVASRNEVSGLCFATLKAGSLGFSGVHDDDINTPADGIKPISQARSNLPEDWQLAKEQWHAAIHNIVTEFLGGTAVVSPLDKTSYAFTGLEPLNRIYGLDSGLELNSEDSNDD